MSETFKPRGKTLCEVFAAEYYQTGNYRDYLTRKFSALAAEIVAATKVKKSGTIIDFGCGYGGLCDAFWKLGYRKVFATDVSQWAVEYGQSVYPHLNERLQYYNRNLLRIPNQLLILLDVLEHMPEYEIESVLKLARAGARGQLAIRVPVCSVEGEPFILPVSNNDPTHICCHTKLWWENTLLSAGFKRDANFGGSRIYDSPGVLAALYSLRNGAVNVDQSLNRR